MRLLLPKPASDSALLWLAKERACCADVMVAASYHDVNTKVSSDQKASLLVMRDTSVLFSETTRNRLYCSDQTLTWVAAFHLLWVAEPLFPIHPNHHSLGLR